jgi:hypothetical protein
MISSSVWAQQKLSDEEKQMLENNQKQKEIDNI